MILDAKHYMDNGDYPKATGILLDLLDDNPNDAQALFLFGALLIKQGKHGLAYNICARAAKLEPENSAIWTNYGICQPDTKEGWSASEWCLNKSIELDGTNSQAYAQMASLMIQMCKPDDAIAWANKALEIDINSQVALGAKAFAYLMKAEWKKGFKYYQNMLQTNFRLDVQYGNLPMWTGQAGETVIVYGEQGIGDEILFSSVLNDMSKDCTIIYDTMPRLNDLMTRSFPDIHVTGDRWSNQLKFPEGLTPTARIPLAGVPVYYRHKQSDFDGKPYLKPNPDHVSAVKGILSDLPNNYKVGIAWTGGSKNSRQQFRTETLESLTQILRTPNIDWVSLQYNDPSEEIAQFEKDRNIKINHYPWITEIKEYDLTAALINELDLIITVPTSAVQVAGGLGVESWVLVPETTGWLFSNKSYPWANSVKLIHKWTAKEIETNLKLWLSGNRKLAKG